MPWPAGGPNVCVLVEETRWPIAAGTVDRLIVAHGLETCDSPRRAAAGDLARAGAGRAGRLHRAEPLGPLGAARRDALRLRPALQLRPARGAAAHATASRPSGTRPRSTRRRRTAASGCRPPTSGSASAAASSPGVVAGALLVEAAKQVYARPPRPAPRSRSRGRSTCSKASPAAQAGAGRRPRPAAAARLSRADSGRRGRSCSARIVARFSVLPRSRRLCYHRADFAGDAGAVPARIRH